MILLGGFLVVGVDEIELSSKLMDVDYDDLNTEQMLFDRITRLIDAGTMTKWKAYTMMLNNHRYDNILRKLIQSYQ